MTRSTHALNAEVLKKLSAEEKKALLQDIMRQNEKRYPVSHGQEALWFLQQRTPDSCAYNVAACLSIESALDPDCFHQALATLVRRHPMLRSRYHMQEGKLRLHIEDDADFFWRVERVEGFGVEMLDAALSEDYKVPFDLARGPLCRGHLYRCAENQWVFLLVVHHIAIDGWSLWQLLDELQKLYTAQRQNRPPALPELRLSYRDFVIAQRVFLNSPKGQRQLAYWLTELSAGDAAPTLQLPTDRPRPPQQTFNGGGCTWTFAETFSSAYKQFCRQWEVTPFVLGLAFYFVLLHRLSNQRDILVATPAAGRDGKTFADVVGYFVNPLPLRARLEGDPEFTAFLAQVKNKVAGALANGDIPFPVLVEKLRTNRDPSYPVLCQAMFVYQKLINGANAVGFDSGTYDWGSLRARHYPLHQQEGQFDLALEILEGEKTLTAHWKYNSDLFQHDTIHSIASAFEQLALHIFSEPQVNLSGVRLVSEARAPELMRPPQVVHIVEQCLHERFSQVAGRHAGKVAVTCGHEQITYAELDRRSTALCRQLHRKMLAQGGAAPGEPIGICLNRSIDLVVALIGVLKAGCCYIPMDPTYPRDRLRYMAEDAALRCIVTNRITAAANGGGPLHSDGFTRVYVDDWEEDEAEACENPFHPADLVPHNDIGQLAYILYTSGSTGRPKGVKVSHANVMRLFDATESLYGFDSSDVWTLFHSYAFDFSVWEVWGALLYGGRLVVVPYEVSRSPAGFYRLLGREKVTVLNQTPSAFQQLMRVALSAEGDNALASLRWVVFGGEALDLQSLRPWFAQYGERKPALVNMYGITETTVHVTWRRLWERDALCPQSLIGRPLPDLHIMILDSHRQVVPVGFPGEVYVGGAGVSRGYLNRDDLSAEKFVDNPVLAGGKLYRTGDLARWVSPTDIAYLGRIDHQIQLRGFRIELGEIENQISTHPGVATATVLLREDAPGDARLVAYYIAAGDAALPWSDIRRHLQQCLPDYMLPAAGVQLAAFPLTDNGKTDRAALPKPDYGAELGADNPRDALEQRIATLWAQVLDLPRVGIKDNFFELGGHSLLAARLAEQLQRALGQPVSIATLLRCPSVEAQAAAVRRQCGGPRSPLIPLQTRGELAPIFCVPGGSGNALYYQPLAQALGQRRPFYGLQAQGLEGDQPPLTSVEAMAAENIRALRGVQPRGPYVLAGHCFGGIVAYEMAQQLAAAGEAVARLVVMDVPAPLPEHRPPSLAWNDTEWLEYFIGVLEESTGVRAGFDRQVATLPFTQQLLHCQRYMERAGLLPADADVKQVKGMMEVFKTNSQTPYRPAVKHHFPITLIRAAEFHPAYDYSAADDAGDIARSSLGWRRAADATLEIVCVPGNHISMLLEPNVAALAHAIHAALTTNHQQKHKEEASRYPQDKKNGRLQERAAI